MNRFDKFKNTTLHDVNFHLSKEFDIFVSRLKELPNVCT